MIKEDGDIVSQVLAAMLQRPLHLSFILANIKEDGFGSLNITSKVTFRNKQAFTLCKEVGEPGDGDGGAVGGGQGDVEEGGRQVEGIS